MNRILITGTAGFLGVNLANYLLKDDKNIVFGVDDFSNSNISNLYTLLKNDRFNLIQENIKTGLNLSVDTVFHLAGSGDLSQYHTNKTNYIYSKIINVKNMLEYCALTGAKFFYITGFPDYSEVKKALNLYFDAENLIIEIIKDFAEDKKLDYKILRLTEAYGKNSILEDKRLIPSTIVKALQNKDIELSYDENVYFTYVDDVVRAIEKILNNYTENNVIDISSPNALLRTDVVKLILKLTKSNSKLILKDNITIKPDFSPDTSYLNNALDFRAGTTILDGITKTVEFFKLAYFS